MPRKLKQVEKHTPLRGEATCAETTANDRHVALQGGCDLCALVRYEPQVVAILLLRIAQGHGDRGCVGDLLVLAGLERKPVFLQQAYGDELRLENRHVHAQANSRANLKHREVLRRRRRERDPSLGLHHLWLRVNAGVSTHRVWQPHADRALGDLRAIWPDVVGVGLLAVARHRGVEPQGLVQHTVEVGHRGRSQQLQCRCRPEWAMSIHLCQQLLLHLRVDRENVEHPSEQARSRVAAGDDKVEDHVSKVRGAELFLLLRLCKKREEVPPLVKLRVRAASRDKALGLRH
mmetsp:Transcript_16637/g.48255  ORF Transcript_16637/g.48255 Transcript_16637/m.48255 type:complete len:290 (+) Transcript_16637:126-995(+)